LNLKSVMVAMRRHPTRFTFTSKADKIFHLPFFFFFLRISSMYWSSGLASNSQG